MKDPIAYINDYPELEAITVIIIIGTCLFLLLKAIL